MSKAREEYKKIASKEDVYCDYCCEQPNGSFSDEYVRWLEEQYNAMSNSNDNNEVKKC